LNFDENHFDENRIELLNQSAFGYVLNRNRGGNKWWGGQTDKKYSFQSGKKGKKVENSNIKKMMEKMVCNFKTEMNHLVSNLGV